MKTNRVLYVDFELYADNDPEFKAELIDGMIENLEELEQSYFQSLSQKDPAHLKKAFHKVQTTLSMLDDKELNAVIENMKDPVLGAEAISTYKQLRVEICSSLRAEKALI
ncbi:MAG: hypothetical protein WKF87_11945 [Chryseolinea sp.]